MGFEELKFRYRLLTFAKRLTISGIIGAIYPIFYLYDEAPAAYEAKESAQQARDNAERRFNKAREQQKALPRLEEKLDATEAELKKASKKLPNEFKMDDILEKTSLIAQDIGIYLEIFDPTTGIPSNTAFKYLELPIHIQLTGSFEQLVTFYDRIVHLDIFVNIRHIEMTPAPIDRELLSSTDKKQESSFVDRLKREYLRITANAEMVIYRSLTDEEASALVQRNPQEQKAKTPAPPAPAS